MSKNYGHIKAIAQPDQTACWSSSLAWWTHALWKVKDHSELDIMGKYNHLTGSDGGLLFPDGYKKMLSDSLWGMTVEETGVLSMGSSIFAKSPVMCGYWDINVGGYHSVALYDYKGADGVWAMDPNGGIHVNRHPAYYFSIGKKTIVGYLK